MPRSRTQVLKRGAGYALRCLERAQEHILELKLTFEPVEPAYAQLAELTLLTLEQAIDSLESFCTHAWGGVPEKIERWTQTGHDWHLLRRKANNFDAVWCLQCEDWVPRDMLTANDESDSGTLLYLCPHCNQPLLIESTRRENPHDDDTAQTDD